MASGALQKRVQYYYAAPELGLGGRWPPELRMSGLDGLLDSCRGKSVLDLGAAEGLVARRFLTAGAALVHGFEIVQDRVTAARRICSELLNGAFWQADLSDWETFRRQHATHLRARYDIVLYLGLHHHIPDAARASTLDGATTMSREVFVLRTPEACYGEERVADRLNRQGFELSEEHSHSASQELGPLRIFMRVDARGKPR